MRNLNLLDQYRFTHPAIDSKGDDTCGWFRIGSLRILASSGEGWDHVSISTPNRIPTWEEMQKVKNLFFLPDEMAVQFHPPKKDYINCCENCLHLWRPHNQKIELPPKSLIA